MTNQDKHNCAMSLCQVADVLLRRGESKYVTEVVWLLKIALGLETEALNASTGEPTISILTESVNSIQAHIEALEDKKP